MCGAALGAQAHSPSLLLGVSVLGEGGFWHGAGSLSEPKNVFCVRSARQREELLRVSLRGAEAGRAVGQGRVEAEAKLGQAG